MLIDKLTSNGPAYASLLREAVTSRFPFDGLLIGSYTRRTELVHHDTADEFTKETLEAHISSFTCSQSLGSFYNAAGLIDVEKVTAVAKNLQGSCLGWFIHQQAPVRQPSSRERTITAALAACVPSGMPVILVLMNTIIDADLSTYSFRHQYHEQAPGTLLLRQRPISIDNIAASRRDRDYRPLRAAADSSKVFIGSPEERKAQEALESPLGRVALHSLGSQTQALEGMYGDMLRQMETLSAQARMDEADLKAIQAEIDGLVAALG